MNNKTTTLDMEIALFRYLDVRRNIIVPNISWSMLRYEADIVSLTKNNYATEIEIKVSKADLLKDKEKRYHHDSNYFKYFYFAVPEHMKDFALENIPDRAGLLVGYWRESYVDLSKNLNTERRLRIFEERKPVENKSCVQWTTEERIKLAELGTMRISTMKKSLQRKDNKIKDLKAILKEQDIQIEATDSTIAFYNNCGKILDE